jgi:hypothetical protein
MGNAVKKMKYRAPIIERTGGASVRVALAQGLLAPRECGRFWNPKNFSWLYEQGLDDIGRRM